MRPPGRRSLPSELRPSGGTTVRCRLRSGWAGPGQNMDSTLSQDSGLLARPPGGSAPPEPTPDPCRASDNWLYGPFPDRRTNAKVEGEAPRLLLHWGLWGSVRKEPQAALQYHHWQFTVKPDRLPNPPGGDLVLSVVLRDPIHHWVQARLHSQGLG